MSQTLAWEEWLAIHDAEYDALKGYACVLTTREDAEQLRDALNVLLEPNDPDQRPGEQPKT